MVGTFTLTKQENGHKGVSSDKLLEKNIMKEGELPLFESAAESCFMIFAIFVRLQLDYT